MAISEAKKISDKRHHEKLDQIILRPHREEGMEIRAAALASGKSVQSYVLEAIRERMELELSNGTP